MNKVFKVIWNEARNAYVVVSEIAKNHGSKSSSTKKLLAMLIATGVMTCASFDVLAAEPTAEPTAAQQYVALKAKEFDKAPLPLSPDRKEYDAQQAETKKIGAYTYRYDKTNKYWVREGYVLTVDKNGGEYTTLSDNAIRADVAYTGTGVPKDILQSVTSTVEANGTVTNMGESLNKVTAGSFAGVSHSGGTEVAGSWNYIIQDSSWKNSDADYSNGYVDLIGKEMPKGFITADSNNGLVWDNNKQAYTYRGKAVDYSNVYVIDGEIGVFTNKEGTKVYTGTVYGKHNEILMTVKDANNKFYSYWAAEVTDPSATMATYRVEEYKKNLAVLEENENKLYRNDIKEVTMTKDGDGATIGLLRNGDNEAGTPVKGVITVTSGGGTEGKDTFVKISNAADTVGKTFATGSKVEVKETTKGAGITSITVNGNEYAINNKVYEAGSNVKIDGNVISATDTTYTAGNGIAIDEKTNNPISVKLKKDENNLEVTADGLALKKDLTVNSVKAGDTTVNTNGLTIGTGDKGIVLSTTNVSMGDQQIHNVAKGTNDTDAVNFGQLKETNTKVENLTVEAGKHTTLVNGENTKATLVKDDANGKQYKVDVDLSGYAKTDNVAVVYVDNNKEKSLHTTNSGKVGSNAIALGKGASAVANSVVIGNGAYTQDGTLTKGQSVALGNGAVTGAKSTSIGSKAVGGREGTITIGANANNGSLYATVIGTDSVINSDETAYKVKIDTLFGTIEKDINIQGATATLVGTSNKVDNKNNLVYSGVANNVMGAANTIEGSNGVTIQGTGNKVTDAYKDMNITTKEGLAILGGDYSVLAKKESGAVAVVGGANTVSKQTDSTVIGYGNKLVGDKEKGNHDVFMAGFHNKLNNVSDSIVMGNENKITGVSNVISFGHKNTISANNAVAIGNGTSVLAEGGVALGVGSVADRAAGEVGYDPATGAKYVIPEDAAASYVWKATKGAVSVGGGRDTRQITNVAAGTEDTDAVNVAQLKTAKTEVQAGANITSVEKTTGANGQDVYTINAKDTTYVAGNGITISGENNAISVKLKEGENNLEVTADGLALKKDLTVNSVKAGEFYMSNAGIGYGDKAYITSNGLNANGQKITGVAAGVNNDDAVNVGQLNAVKETANKGWNLSTNSGEVVNVAPDATVDFSGDKNISVSNDGTKVKVELKDELKDIKSISNGDKTISLDGTALLLKNGDATLAIAKGAAGMQNGAGASVVLNGTQTVINGGVTFDHTGKITNVKAGEADTDAVNVSQLNAVKETANKGWNLSTNGGKVVNVAPDAKVDFSGDDNITVSNDGTNVKVELKDELKDIKSISNGDKTISLDGTALLLKNGDATLAIAKGAAGMQNGAGASVVLNGTQTVINGGVTFDHTGKITNVKAGEADTDAVNVGQLKEAVEAGNTDTHIKAGEYGVGTDNKVNMQLVDKNGNDAGTVTITDVAKASDVGNISDLNKGVLNKDGSKTTVVDAINNIDTRVGNVETKVEAIGAIAKAHNVVSNTDKNITVDSSKKTEDGGTIFDVNLNKDKLDLNNVVIEGNKGKVTAIDVEATNVNATAVTTGQTVMNNDGLKVGENVSVTATAVTVGKTSISDEGVKVGDKTYISADGLNANGHKITNVADGKENTDAVNVGQLKDSETKIYNRIDGVENQVVNNTNRISNLDNRVNKVGAGAAALAALHPLDFDPDAKWDFAAGYGNYRGTNAAAVGAYYRPNEDTMFSVGGTFGNGENMVNAGVSFKLGSGSSHVSTSRVAMAKEIKELRGELEAMKSAMLDANAGKKIDTSKLQLFPDVPQNHWAYEYVTQLAGNGMIEGYPDGNFAGDRPMTRYEFAAILYRAMTKGAVLSDKILSEFSHELEYFTVDTVAKDKAGNPTIQRVRTVKANTNK